MKQRIAYLLTSVLIGLAGAGCELITSVDRDQIPSGSGGAISGGSGGTDAGTDAPSTGATGGSGGAGGSAGSGGSAGTDGGGSGGTGGVPCTSPASCPDPGNECLSASCENSICA